MIAPTACGCKRAKEPESVCGWSSAALSARNRPHWPETHRHGIVSENHNTAQLPPIDRRPALRNGSPALARSFRFRIPQPPAPRGRQDRAGSQVVYPHTGPTRVGPFLFGIAVFLSGRRDVPSPIEGRHSAARVKRASPESITTIGSRDSGPAPSKSALADLANDIAELG